MRLSRLLLLLLVALLAACSTSTAATPERISANGEMGDVSLTSASASGSSATGPGSLAQLLTAPRPVPPTTVAPGEEGKPAEPPPPPYKTGPRPASPVVTPPTPLPPGDGTVYAVGDSVLLGAHPYLAQTVGGWDLRLDGKVGRRFPEGVELIRENRNSIGQAVVVMLGHNDGSGRQIYGYLDEIMAVLRTTPRVVFVTVTEWTPAQAEINRALKAMPSVYGNVVIADWAGVVAANPQFLNDNVHLNGAGSTALANLIAVMLGPARKNGETVPPLKILPIPDGPSGGGGTTTTVPPATTSTTAPTATSSTTSTSTPATTAPTTTSSTTTTAPPPTSTSSSLPVPPAPPP